MSLRSLLLLIIGAAITAFVGVNWAAMTAPTQLDLIFTQIHAPLGLVLLGLMVLLSVVFVGLIAYTQGTVLIETRRHAKELAAQRELADKAEASRFTDLRAHLDTEVKRLSEAIAGQGRDVLARVDRAEMGLRERPVDAEIGHLARALDGLNRDLHARVDRLEMGLRDGLSGYTPALPTMRPATPPPAVPNALQPADVQTLHPAQDPVGSAVPR